MAQFIPHGATSSFEMGFDFFIFMSNLITPSGFAQLYPTYSLTPFINITKNQFSRQVDPLVGQAASTSTPGSRGLSERRQL